MFVSDNHGNCNYTSVRSAIFFHFKITCISQTNFKILLSKLVCKVNFIKCICILVFLALVFPFPFQLFVFYNTLGSTMYFNSCIYTFCYWAIFLILKLPEKYFETWLVVKSLTIHFNDLFNLFYRYILFFMWSPVRELESTFFSNKMFFFSILAKTMLFTFHCCIRKRDIIKMAEISNFSARTK